MSGLVSSLRFSVLFAAIAIIASLPGAAVDWLTAPPAPGARLSFPAEHPPATAVDDSPALADEAYALEDESPREYDIRGNEIVRPVERYSVDPGGMLYELHSPQTEIPRLPSPEL